MVTAFILWYNIADANGFNTIWRYFGWANQTLSVFTLWAITVFLAKTKKGSAFVLTLVPACLMTSVCTTYICTAKIGLNIPMSFNTVIGITVAILSLVLFFFWKMKYDKSK